MAIGIREPTMHPTLTTSFAERGLQAGTSPLKAYLYHLMTTKKSNLCLSADVCTSSELLEVAEECGDSICVLKTHCDICSDFSDETIKALTEVSLRKKFLIFEDRKFGDIGNTVAMQYAYGPYKIASWASITNAHIFPGPDVVTSLKQAAQTAVSNYNSKSVTEIVGSTHQNGATPSSGPLDPPSPTVRGSAQQPGDAATEVKRNAVPAHLMEEFLQGAFIYVTTEITISAEHEPPPSNVVSGDGQTEVDKPPLARGLLLLAQMSSAGNLMTREYTDHCVENARREPEFVIGFIAQESLNTQPGDNFIVMTPGVSLPPVDTAASQTSEGLSKPAAKALTGDGQGQQYNTPRDVILGKGVDIAIVGRGILNAPDRVKEAERYRQEAWQAYLERIGGTS